MGLERIIFGDVVVLQRSGEIDSVIRGEDTAWDNSDICECVLRRFPMKKARSNDWLRC
jgi:hypothetical protein